MAPDGTQTASASLTPGRAAALARRKQIALAMLAVAALVFVVGTWLEMRHPHWGFELLVAMAEAAMIGGLADWFAVVALFRHPLGQRWIPHTAIIPAKKEALGAALADFICEHFLEKEEVLRKVREFDPGGRVAAALSRPENAEKVGGFVVNLAPHLLELLDSERLHRLLHNLARDALRQVDVSALAGQVLETLTHERRHQALLDSVLRDLGSVLADPATRDMVADRITPQLWSVLRLARLDEPLARRLAAQVVSGVGELVLDMGEDPQHELRLRFDDYVEDFVERLRTDPSLRLKGEQLRDRVIDDPALPGYIRGVWGDLMSWLRADLEHPGSVTRRKASDAALAVGARLAADRELQAWINQWLFDAVEPMVERYRGSIRGFIVERISRWDTSELVEQLELSVGSDLQYIRYNGTAIGALIGGLLYGVVQAIGWLATAA